MNGCPGHGWRKDIFHVNPAECPQASPSKTGGVHVSEAAVEAAVFSLFDAGVRNFGSSEVRAALEAAAAHMSAD